jgi:RHS repeat-associated protein
MHSRTHSQLLLGLTALVLGLGLSACSSEPAGGGGGAPPEPPGAAADAGADAPVGNQAPVVSAGPPQTVSLPRDAVFLNGSVSDDGLPAGGRLTVAWTKVSGPGKVVFRPADVPATMASFDAIGTYVLRLTADDGELQASGEVRITITPMNQPPEVSAGEDKILLLPQNRVTLNGRVRDDGRPVGGALTVVWRKLSGPGPVAFASPNAAVTEVTFAEAGVYRLRLSASDTELESSATVTVKVIPSGPVPTVAITSPADGAEVKAPTEVIGSVSGGAWQLDYRLDGDESVPSVWVPFASGNRPVANASLGTLDPTLMVNGSYLVRLSATTASGTATATISVIVSGGMKVGNFTVAFNDLSVTIAKLPIQIVRGYDSRDRRPGDFDAGWTLATQSIRLEKTANLSTRWSQTQSGGIIPTYCVRHTRPHRITITLPDGKVYKFESQITPECQQIAPIKYVRMSFVALPGTHGTLVPFPGGDEPLIIVGTAPGSVEIVDYGTAHYNPGRFKFTTREGTAYILDQKAGLLGVAEPNGATLTIDRGGITHSSGKAVTFTRDAQGRITRITDPAGNPMEYTYTINGDLAGVKDREGNVTTFQYDGDHLLTGIRDTRNIQAIRSEFDDQGRLLRHRDAAGKVIEYKHDIGSREEVITDRVGGVRVLTYDDDGNVIQEQAPDGSVTRRTFDVRSNQLTETNALGHTTTSTYDDQDNLTSHTDAQGNKTSYVYNSRGQVLTTRDPLGRETKNEYDRRGNLTATRDALGGITRMEYNAKGHLISRTDALGCETRYQTDAAGKVIEEKDALGHVTTHAYGPNGERLTTRRTRTTASGVETLETKQVYDRQGRVIETREADGSVTRTAFDGDGRQTATIDPLGRRTDQEHDDLGRLVRTRHADGTFEETSFDAEGRRVASTDRAGRRTEYTNDALGRVIRTRFADGATVVNAYDVIGQLVAVTDGRGNTTRYRFDKAGRRTQTIDALGAMTESMYDTAGNLIATTDARGHNTVFVYDELNRRTATIFHDGTEKKTVYDRMGRPIEQIDEAGRTTRFKYSCLGQLIQVTDALGQVTEYGYEETGSRILQKDARGNITRFEFDKRGRQIGRILPDGERETMVLDAAGNLIRKTDFAGHTIRYHYDLNNRLTRRDYPDGSRVVITYTPTGQRASVADRRGVTRYEQDSRDRLIGLRYPDGRSLAWKYDEAGNRTQLTATIGATSLTTEYTFDAVNRLGGVKDPQGRRYILGYEKNGLRASVQYPNGVATAYSHDARNRLTGLVTKRMSGEAIQSYAYTLGKTGTRTKIEEHGGTVREYGYDPLYRLIQEKVIRGGALAYENRFLYDRVSNRVTQQRGATTINSTYDNRDRLLTENSTTYDWDKNGNLVTRSGSDGATYVWDDDNRLKKVTKADGTVVEHDYDFDGIRVWTKVTPPAGPPMETHHLVDPSGPLSHVVAETDGAGALKALYVRGDDLLAVLRGAQARYYHPDGLGSTRKLTDEAGKVTDSYDYSAFGELLEHAGTHPQPYQFAGEPFESSSGLSYNRARWLLPQHGRFVSMDDWPGSTRIPMELHRYLYGDGQPTLKTDPTGRCPYCLGVLQLFGLGIGYYLYNRPHINQRVPQNHMAPALASASGLVSNAITVLEDAQSNPPRDPVGSQCASLHVSARWYCVFFGNQFPDRIGHVLRGFYKIREALGQAITFYYGDGHFPDGSGYESHGDYGSLNITLGPKYWERAMTGYRSRPGIIIHELSHNVHYTNYDDHTDTDPATSEVYGLRAAMDLARNDPEHAIRNADNYEFFAESYWFGMR